MRAVAGLLLLSGLGSAQSIEILSEFQRVDPFGKVVQADRMERRREILSPAVVRNAFASFHLSVTIPEGSPSFLYIQQNPERFHVTVYKEIFVKTPGGWVPDGLEKVSVPHFLILPDTQNPIPHQTTQVFWLDLWAPAEIPAERMRFEAVLKSGDRWVVSPMEIRIKPGIVPVFNGYQGTVAGVEARADASLTGALRQMLCGSGTQRVKRSQTVRDLIRRNAAQDAALLALHPKADVVDYLKMRLGARWCEKPVIPASLPVEWYLRARDLLYH